MAKKKNKRKKSAVPEKIKHAQRINDLKRKLYQIFVAAGAGDVFNLLPPLEMKVLLMFRMKPIDVEIVEGAELTPDIVDYIKKMVVRMMKNKTIKLCENGPDVTLYDYLYVGEQVRYFLRNIKESDFPDAGKILDAFQSFLKITNEDLFIHETAIKIAETAAYALSDITTGIITLKYDYATEQKSPPVFYNRFLLNIHQPPMIAIKIDNEIRKAYRLLWLASSSEVFYAKIPLDKIGLNQQIKNLKSDVYIQKHALERMKERLDCINPQLLNLILIFNVMECKISTNQKGQQLIEFLIDKAKVGYLTFNYAEGVVVIRTFLLITNNDTPEGEKLHRQLGVEKLDKQYLGIDKLSAFANSNIEENPTLKKAFEKAGCGGLFNIPQYIPTNNKNQIHNAEKIIEYLELNKISSELNEYESIEEHIETNSIST